MTGDAPMRPKPLMATFTLASVVVLTAAAQRGGAKEGSRGSEGREAEAEVQGKREPDVKARVGIARTLTALPRLRPAV